MCPKGYKFRNGRANLEVCAAIYTSDDKKNFLFLNKNAILDDSSDIKQIVLMSGYTLDFFEDDQCENEIDRFHGLFRNRDIPVESLSILLTLIN